jgi:hypothetical protein
MRSRLLTLVVLILSAWMLSQFGLSEDMAAEPPPSGGLLFPGLETRDVDFISMRFRTGEVVDFTREGQGPWLINFPTDELAQMEFVEALVRNLANAKVLPVEEQGGAIDPEQVGLGKRAKSVAFGRGEQRITLKVGIRNPLGPGVFARIEGTPHVVLVTENIDTMLESFRGQDYVDKHLLRGLKGSVDRIRVERPDGVLLDARKEGDRWTLLEPEVVLADSGRISLLVRTLQFIQQMYPADVDPTDSELADFGFPNAAQLAEGDYGMSTLVELGAPGQSPARAFLEARWLERESEIFAIREDLAKVLVIDRHELNLLLNEPDFFRERRLLPPVRDRARRVRIRVGDETLLDVSQDDRGLWTFRTPERLAGVALDSERVDGHSLVSAFLGRIDDLEVTRFGEVSEGEPVASLEVNWNWAGSDRRDRVDLFALTGDEIPVRASGRPTEGLFVGPELLELIRPELADHLRGLRPIDIDENTWGQLVIQLPELDAPLVVTRPGPGTSWQGDDPWGRRFGLGHDLQTLRGLGWQLPPEDAEYPWRIEYRGFGGELLGSLELRGAEPDETQLALGQPVIMARWSGVPGMELLVPASLLDRVAALARPQQG